MTKRVITEEEVQRFWDGNAPTWIEQVRLGSDLTREYFNNAAFFKFIGDLKGKRVLDAGCGEGHNTRILAKTGARVEAVDISSEMIASAREEERKHPLGIKYHDGSFSDLSIFETQTFDAIVSTMAVMDTPNYHNALSEFHKVLVDGGELFFSITHPCFITKGVGWIDRNGNDPRLTVSEYFDPEHVVEKWRFSGCLDPANIPLFQVPRFPRTMSEYINGVIDAGFVIRRVAEPRPNEEHCKMHAGFKVWRLHAAMLFYVHATRT